MQGICNGWITFAFPMLREAPRRVRVEGDVFLRGPVAGFARDANLAKLRVQFGVVLRLRLRLAGGRVALNAVGVPELDRRGSSRVHQKRVVARDPALLLKEKRERQAELQV